MRFGVGLYWFKGALLRIQSPEFGLKLFQEEYKVPFLDPAVAMHLANFNETVCSCLLMDCFRAWQVCLSSSSSC